MAGGLDEAGQLGQQTGEGLTQESCISREHFEKLKSFLDFKKQKQKPLVFFRPECFPSHPRAFGHARWKHRVQLVLCTVDTRGTVSCPE